MSEETAAGEAPPRRSFLKIFYEALGISLLVLLLAFFSPAVFMVEVPIRFVLGWAFHLHEMVPALLPKWSGLLLPLACLALTAALVHRFVRWWLRVKGSERPWSFAQSSALLGLVLLGSGAAIAISGIVHQLAWIPQGEVLVNPRRSSDRSMILMRTRELLMVMEDFIETRSRYPANLKEIEEFTGSRVPKTWISLSRKSAPEPFLLVQPGAPRLRHSESPVRLISPELEGRVVVGFEDGSCSPYPAGLVNEWLERLLKPSASEIPAHE